jgi:hypothetical protein
MEREFPRFNDPEQIFTETSVRQLVQDAKIRRPVDIAKLRAGLVDAAKNFAAERARDGNAVHREIAKLHAAAQHRRFKVVAAALAGLSSPAREILRQRDQSLKESTSTPHHPAERKAVDAQDTEQPIRLAQRAGAAREGSPEVITRRRRQERQASGPILPPLPQPTDLVDPDKRERACVAVIDRCEIGGRKVLGRKRPSGRRSWTWKPVLWAPELNPHPEIRSAERTFIMWLQIAWRDATGINVPVTAHPDNPGPFARLAQKALVLLGAPHADAVQLINDLEHARNDLVTSQDLKDPPDSSG